MTENFNKVIDGWFSEICPMWPGAALSFEIEKPLYSRKSRYQQIDLFETKHHGRMLVMDGKIQLTEYDEFAYHEMLAHVPLFSHPAPEDVLIIGGGDGGILREAGRHSCIRRLDICEIDEDVITACRQFLPDISCGFNDPRASVYIEDAALFLERAESRYDVIIIDSTDPEGPAEALFEKKFYEKVKKALKPGGIAAAQGESFFMHAPYVAGLMKIFKGLFPLSAYSCFLVPTYPGGNIGACIGSLGPRPETPVRDVPMSMQKTLRYYTPRIHETSFVLPGFADKMLKSL